MAWTPPADDPGLVTSADYSRALDGLVAEWSGAFQPGSHDARGHYAWEYVPLFANAWRRTGDAKYAQFSTVAVQRWRAGFTALAATAIGKGGGRDDLVGLFRQGAPIAQLLMGVSAFGPHPSADAMRAQIGDGLVDVFEQLPTFWESGAMNRSWSAALLYDVALAYGRPTARAADLRGYANDIWDLWWPLRDVDEDSERYSPQDLVLLHGWTHVRGVDWRLDPPIVALFEHYAELISNDGTFPAYGDSGLSGDYMIAVWIATAAARATRDGRYTTLAHRAFWNGRDRLAALEKGLGNTQSIHLALAALECDEAVTERPLTAGSVLSRRRMRERTDWSTIPDRYALWRLHEPWQPSKLVYRSGPATSDSTLIVLAGNHAGHGHPDAGAVVHYGGAHSTYLASGAARADLDLEQHNVVALSAEPSRRWRGHVLASEGCAVPIRGDLSGWTYARLRIGAYPGAAPTQEAWDALRVWNATGDGYNPWRLAIGYKNWPVTLDRAVLAGPDFVVVRDTLRFDLAVQATVSQNWCVGEIEGADPAGRWVRHRIARQWNFEYPGDLAPIETGPGHLLLWTHGGEAVRTGDLAPTDPAYRVTLPHRAWAPRTGDWAASSRLSLTTVLVPLGPTEPPPDITPHDLGPGALALRVDHRHRQTWVVLGAPRRPTSVLARPTLAAEAAVISRHHARSRVRAWGLHHPATGRAHEPAGPDGALRRRWIRGRDVDTLQPATSWPDLPPVLRGA